MALMHETQGTVANFYNKDNSNAPPVLRAKLLTMLLR